MNKQLSGQVRVWDLPLRLFHWSLVILVGVSIYTGLVGGFVEMDYHMLSGYAILTLIIFRIAWGFAGSEHSRFSSFVKPARIVPYLRSLPGPGHKPHAGHNPLGALSVLAMLLALLVQALTGLFANDDILLEGPLYHLVSEDMSDRLTSIHHYNTWVIYCLLGLHGLAILYYEIVKGERLALPMITGRKRLEGAGTRPGPARELAVAAVILAAAAAATWYLVNRV